MKNFSKFALTSIAALTVASPLVNTEVDAKDKVSATQNIDAKVTQESQATNALKELPKSENIKKHYKHTKISYEEIYDDRFFHSYFL